MLAAFALGFNAMWKTGGPAYDETVKQALGFASSDASSGSVLAPRPRRLRRRS